MLTYTEYTTQLQELNITVKTFNRFFAQMQQFIVF